MNNPHRPRKRFGQNFLRDANVMAEIMQCIAVKAADHIVEIGPGLGAITERLLVYRIQLSAIEIDRDLVLHLQNRFAAHANFKLYAADALRFDFNRLGSLTQKLRLVGNLPYNISTPLLFHLCAYNDIIADMHFMLQKEVVERMAASPNSKAYGRLSVMMQYHYLVQPLLTIPPEAFDPKPAVMSRIVRLTPHPAHEKPHTDNYQHFSDIVRLAFNQRRKTLSNALSSVYSPQQISNAEIDPKARAEQLSLSDFVRLSQVLE